MTKKIRILHIDDNLHDRQLVKDALLKDEIEFEILEAENRQKFEQIISELNFDLVLSDFNILGFDGLQVLQVVREKNSEIPVIIVTGTGSEEIAVEAMKLGADDYVIKSVKHIQNLIPTIKKVLENRKIQLEHKKTLLALKESEERFRLLFDNSMDAVMLTIPDGGILKANPAACNIFGRTLEELRQFGRKYIIEETDPRFSLALEERSRTGKFNGELTGLRKDGTPFPIEISSAIFLDGDGNKRSSMIIRDITLRKETELLLIEKSKKIEVQNDEYQLLNQELLKTNKELQKAKEKAEESDRLKTAFLHNISHEIRTPMNAIMGFSGLLKDPNLSHDKRKLFTEIVTQNSNQLLSIIDDLVNIATIEAGLEKINESDVDLNLTLMVIYKDFSRKAIKQNINFNIESFPPDSADKIVTDEIKFIKVLTNLIDNAVKFTKQGQVSFGYQIVKEKNVPFLQFFIQDTGIGIPVSMHKEIFKRFHQLENSPIHQFGGSGLGLSISKAYVELLGGKIWLKSEIGKGSTFYFTIPCKKVKKGALSGKKSDTELDLEINKAITLLVAEDEDSNFRLLEELLIDSNITLLRAIDGLEAVEICKSNPHIDLVLMDIKMPIMDGYTATKQIREFLPDLPIIAQTAYTTDADRDKAFACGCDDFISKPFNVDVLISKIKEQLHKI